MSTGNRHAKTNKKNASPQINSHPEIKLGVMRAKEKSNVTKRNITMRLPRSLQSLTETEEMTTKKKVILFFLCHSGLDPESLF